MSTTYEYRPIIRRPASILDTAEDRERGYIDETGARQASLSLPLARRLNYALASPEESHATVVGWERREVTYTKWVRYATDD